MRRGLFSSGQLGSFRFVPTSAGLPLLIDDGELTYLYGPSSTPIAQVDALGEITYLHEDMLGSVRLLTADTGAVQGTTEFDVYGARSAHLGLADSAIGYTGNWTDPTTGLVYLRARDYDPSTGQFLTVDPIVDNTRQPHAYAANNPLVLTDPTGLCVGIDNTPQDRRCEYNDFFWNGFLPGLQKEFDQRNQNIGAALTGFGDGASGGTTRALTDWMVPGAACVLHGNDYYEPSRQLGAIALVLLMGAIESSGSPVGVTSPKANPNWAEVAGSLRTAAATKCNFGLGNATRAEAEALGDSWVGPGATWSSTGKALISEDGLRQWRPTSWKPDLGIYQSNFEWRSDPRGQWVGNGHLNITGMDQ